MFNDEIVTKLKVNLVKFFIHGGIMNTDGAKSFREYRINRKWNVLVFSPTLYVGSTVMHRMSCTAMAMEMSTLSSIQ